MKQVINTTFIVCLLCNLILVTIGISIKSENNTQCYYHFEPDVLEEIGSKLNITLKTKPWFLVIL